MSFGIEGPANAEAQIRADQTAKSSQSVQEGAGWTWQKTNPNAPRRSIPG